MYCENCGVRISSSDAFCGNCGERAGFQKREGEIGWYAVVGALSLFIVIAGFKAGMYIFERGNPAIAESIPKKEVSRELAEENRELKERIDALNKKLADKDEAEETDEGDEYFGDKHKVTIEDLKELSREDIVLLRNEIYARSGYVFKDKKLRDYFSSTDWYSPNKDFNENMLDSVEKENLGTIIEYERQMGWR